MTSPLTLHDTAHAKINLFLHVTGRRPDGYHLLDSLAVFTEVGDRLTAELRTDGNCTLSIHGPFGTGLSSTDDNLILKAAQLLKIHAKSSFGAHITLEKNLPVASGIGGGSADAAATLRLLSTLWNIPKDLLKDIAPKLGADVPVCLAQRATRMQGIGEVLKAVPAMPAGGIMLVNPGVAVSTPDIFRRFSANGGPKSRTEPNLPCHWDGMEHLVSVLDKTTNDLQPPATGLAPIINDTLQAISFSTDCLLSRMSGSGATCFGLFPTARSAQLAAQELQKQYNWWVWGGAFASAEK
ncbi:4-diphosphocytidyl-2-C-methyl-D-erythritol kinase [Neokomagataea thailandica NBRC 106555]|uniref:4-diphosphocytidyl-2-C-methyl-D-erythritol kinase n=2 Tax=Neokomagataea TaxID=1223423 RepID=A0A4Y6V597_9PROT|nr:MULTISPECIES: 4-(cytidine 5'-diphospho)-2-C-methyl-D-erythritol kinase [Neokomagataea]QDH25103.1 4-(cytidine 5'-diphospho)-2-C-methyl-D-erythritol kinase [Neokomagataea tanensis]GBR52147.1 4-diphosphocytidyl-2-C-methyl-D-erythritol kinase [Neokomagataea thailandica NBRC 106555]